ncbi:MAG: hypothetical protein S4CHLAM45_15390 [Chlamydiales bacterium]|nr:hypothetical protein [Chlamydiales bacterium]MCH9620156.1 hypothetical protein [Chlamydiales bacterium]MCH9623626.1 hypothetical protein [Chlamydiales bacterium]
MKMLDVVAWVFLMIGGITWGCIGFFNWNLVDFFFGNYVVQSVIYDIVGVSAVWSIVRSKWTCCKK